MKKKISLTAGVLALALTLCACGEALDTGNRVWVDSDLEDSIKESDEFRAQDDFAACANKDWKLQTTGYSPSMRAIADSVMEKKKQIVTDTSLEGYEAELLRNYYDLAVDWDARNADGTDPLKEYIEAIDAAGSLDELLTWMKDPESNPLAVAPVLISMEYVVQSEVYEG
ncbi:MAG: hypothetical protein K6E33_06000, partial [Lachnospiraceae bacterium]|nr:hypothetical protein [Lachnospiraceae bacterium]